MFGPIWSIDEKDGLKAEAAGGFMLNEGEGAPTPKVIGLAAPVKSELAVEDCFSLSDLLRY